MSFLLPIEKVDLEVQGLNDKDKRTCNKIYNEIYDNWFISYEGDQSISCEQLLYGHEDIVNKCIHKYYVEGKIRFERKDEIMKFVFDKIYDLILNMFKEYIYYTLSPSINRYKTYI